MDNPITDTKEGLLPYKQQSSNIRRQNQILAATLGVYNCSISEKFANNLLRAIIKATGKSKIKQEFVEATRRALSFLQYYNDNVKKATSIFPYSEELLHMLAAYVELEISYVTFTNVDSSSLQMALQLLLMLDMSTDDAIEVILKVYTRLTKTQRKMYREYLDTVIWALLKKNHKADKVRQAMETAEKSFNEAKKESSKLTQYFLFNNSYEADDVHQSEKRSRSKSHKNIMKNFTVAETNTSLDDQFSNILKVIKNGSYRSNKQESCMSGPRITKRSQYLSTTSSNRTSQIVNKSKYPKKLSSLKKLRGARQTFRTISQENTSPKKLANEKNKLQCVSSPNYKLKQLKNERVPGSSKPRKTTTSKRQPQAIDKQKSNLSSITSQEVIIINDDDETENENENFCNTPSNYDVENISSEEDRDIFNEICLDLEKTIQNSRLGSSHRLKYETCSENSNSQMTSDYSSNDKESDFETAERTMCGELRTNCKENFTTNLGTPFKEGSKLEEVVLNFPTISFQVNRKQPEKLKFLTKKLVDQRLTQIRSEDNVTTSLRSELQFQKRPDEATTFSKENRKENVSNQLSYVKPTSAGIVKENIDKEHNIRSESEEITTEPTCEDISKRFFQTNVVVTNNIDSATSTDEKPKDFSHLSCDQNLVLPSKPELHVESLIVTSTVTPYKMEQENVKEYTSDVHEIKPNDNSSVEGLGVQETLGEIETTDSFSSIISVNSVNLDEVNESSLNNSNTLNNTYFEKLDQERKVITEIIPNFSELDISNNIVNEDSLQSDVSIENTKENDTRLVETNLKPQNEETLICVTDVINNMVTTIVENSDIGQIEAELNCVEEPPPSITDAIKISVGIESPHNDAYVYYEDTLETHQSYCPENDTVCYDMDRNPNSSIEQNLDVAEEVVIEDDINQLITNQDYTIQEVVIEEADCSQIKTDGQLTEENYTNLQSCDLQKNTDVHGIASVSSQEDVDNSVSLENEDDEILKTRNELFKSLSLCDTSEQRMLLRKTKSNALSGVFNKNYAASDFITQKEKGRTKLGMPIKYPKFDKQRIQNLDNSLKLKKSKLQLKTEPVDVKEQKLKNKNDKCYVNPIKKKKDDNIKTNTPISKLMASDNKETKINKSSKSKLGDSISNTKGKTDSPLPATKLIINDKGSASKVKSTKVTKRSSCNRLKIEKIMKSSSENDDSDNMSLHDKLCRNKKRNTEKKLLTLKKRSTSNKGSKCKDKNAKESRRSSKKRNAKVVKIATIQDNALDMLASVALAREKVSSEENDKKLIPNNDGDDKETTPTVVNANICNKALLAEESHDDSADERLIIDEGPEPLKDLDENVDKRKIETSETKVINDTETSSSESKSIIDENNFLNLKDKLVQEENGNLYLASPFSVQFYNNIDVCNTAIIGEDIIEDSLVKDQYPNLEACGTWDEKADADISSVITISDSKTSSHIEGKCTNLLDSTKETILDVDNNKSIDLSLQQISSEQFINSSTIESFKENIMHTEYVATENYYPSDTELHQDQHDESLNKVDGETLDSDNIISNFDAHENVVEPPPDSIGTAVLENSTETVPTEEKKENVPCIESLKTSIEINDKDEHTTVFESDTCENASAINDSETSELNGENKLPSQDLQYSACPEKSQGATDTVEDSTVLSCNASIPANNINSEQIKVPTPTKNSSSFLIENLLRPSSKDHEQPPQLLNNTTIKPKSKIWNPFVLIKRLPNTYPTKQSNNLPSQISQSILSVPEDDDTKEHAPQIKTKGARKCFDDFNGKKTDTNVCEKDSNYLDAFRTVMILPDKFDEVAAMRNDLPENKINNVATTKSKKQNRSGQVKNSKTVNVEKTTEVLKKEIELRSVTKVINETNMGKQKKERRNSLPLIGDFLPEKIAVKKIRSRRSTNIEISDENQLTMDLIVQRSNKINVKDGCNITEEPEELKKDATTSKKQSRQNKEIKSLKNIADMMSDNSINNMPEEIPTKCITRAAEAKEKRRLHESLLEKSVCTKIEESTDLESKAYVKKNSNNLKKKQQLLETKQLKRSEKKIVPEVKEDNICSNSVIPGESTTWNNLITPACEDKDTLPLSENAKESSLEKSLQFKSIASCENLIETLPKPLKKRAISENGRTSFEGKSITNENSESSGDTSQTTNSIIETKEPCPPEHTKDIEASKESEKVVIIESAFHKLKKDPKSLKQQAITESKLKILGDNPTVDENTEDLPATKINIQSSTATSAKLDTTECFSKIVSVQNVSENNVSDHKMQIAERKIVSTNKENLKVASKKRNKKTKSIDNICKILESNKKAESLSDIGKDVESNTSVEKECIEKVDLVNELVTNSKIEIEKLDTVETSMQITSCATTDKIHNIEIADTEILTKPVQKRPVRAKKPKQKRKISKKIIENPALSTTVNDLHVTEVNEAKDCTNNYDLCNPSNIVSGTSTPIITNSTDEYVLDLSMLSKPEKSTELTTSLTIDKQAEIEVLTVKEMHLRNKHIELESESSSSDDVCLQTLKDKLQNRINIAKKTESNETNAHGNAIEISNGSSLSNCTPKEKSRSNIKKKDNDNENLTLICDLSTKKNVGLKSALTNTLKSRKRRSSMSVGREYTAKRTKKTVTFGEVHYYAANYNSSSDEAEDNASLVEPVLVDEKFSPETSLNKSTDSEINEQTAETICAIPSNVQETEENTNALEPIDHEISDNLVLRKTADCNSFVESNEQTAELIFVPTPIEPLERNPTDIFESKPEISSSPENSESISNSNGNLLPTTICLAESSNTNVNDISEMYSIGEHNVETVSDSSVPIADLNMPVECVNTNTHIHEYISDDDETVVTNYQEKLPVFEDIEIDKENSTSDAQNDISDAEKMKICQDTRTSPKESTPNSADENLNSSLIDNTIETTNSSLIDNAIETITNFNEIDSSATISEISTAITNLVIAEEPLKREASFSSEKDVVSPSFDMVVPSKNEDRLEEISVTSENSQLESNNPDASCSNDLINNEEEEKSKDDITSTKVVTSEKVITKTNKFNEIKDNKAEKIHKPDVAPPIAKNKLKETEDNSITTFENMDLSEDTLKIELSMTNNKNDAVEPCEDKDTEFETESIEPIIETLSNATSRKSLNADILPSIILQGDVEKINNSTDINEDDMDKVLNDVINPGSFISHHDDEIYDRFIWGDNLEEPNKSVTYTDPATSNVLEDINTETSNAKVLEEIIPTNDVIEDKEIVDAVNTVSANSSEPLVKDSLNNKVGECNKATSSCILYSVLDEVLQPSETCTAGPSNPILPLSSCDPLINGNTFTETSETPQSDQDNKPMTTPETGTASLETNEDYWILGDDQHTDFESSLPYEALPQTLNTSMSNNTEGFMNSSFEKTYEVPFPCNIPFPSGEDSNESNTNTSENQLIANQEMWANPPSLSNFSDESFQSNKIDMNQMLGNTEMELNTLPISNLVQKRCEGSDFINIPELSPDITKENSITYETDNSSFDHLKYIDHSSVYNSFPTHLFARLNSESGDLPHLCDPMAYSLQNNHNVIDQGKEEIVITEPLSTKASNFNFKGIGNDIYTNQEVNKIIPNASNKNITNTPLCELKPLSELPDIQKLLDADMKSYESIPDVQDAKFGETSYERTSIHQNNTSSLSDKCATRKTLASRSLSEEEIFRPKKIKLSSFEKKKEDKQVCKSTENVTTPCKSEAEKLFDILKNSEEPIHNNKSETEEKYFMGNRKHSKTKVPTSKPRIVTSRSSPTISLPATSAQQSKHTKTIESIGLLKCDNNSMPFIGNDFDTPLNSTNNSIDDLLLLPEPKQTSASSNSTNIFPAKPDEHPKVLKPTEKLKDSASRDKKYTPKRISPHRQLLSTSSPVEEFKPTVQSTPTRNSSERTMPILTEEIPITILSNNRDKSRKHQIAPELKSEERFRNRNAPQVEPTKIEKQLHNQYKKSGQSMNTSFSQSFLNDPSKHTTNSSYKPKDKYADLKQEEFKSEKRKSNQIDVKHELLRPFIDLTKKDERKQVPHETEIIDLNRSQALKHSNDAKCSSSKPAAIHPKYEHYLNRDEMHKRQKEINYRKYIEMKKTERSSRLPEEKYNFREKESVGKTTPQFVTRSAHSNDQRVYKPSEITFDKTVPDSKRRSYMAETQMGSKSTYNRPQRTFDPSRIHPSNSQPHKSTSVRESYPPERREKRKSEQPIYHVSQKVRGLAPSSKFYTPPSTLDILQDMPIAKEKQEPHSWNCVGTLINPLGISFGDNKKK